MHPVGVAAEPPATRVVIAEDEAIIRMDLREILLESGYDVVAETGRGDEVVELVDMHEPEVAVLDVKMPGRDGVSVARELVAARRCAVVLLTAFSQRELIVEARDAGVLGYVVKPFEGADLVPAIEMALGRFRDLRALETELDSARSKLEGRKLVDRAKGRLMDAHHLSEEDAFRFLQQEAMRHRLTIEVVSTQVIEGTLRP